MRKRLLRIVLVAGLLLGLASANAGAAAAPARTFSEADALEREVLAELNAVRKANGLVPLRLSRALASAADVHSRAMGMHGFFAHDSRDGAAFWLRVRRFYGQGSSRTWSVGENLLWSTPGLDARRAVELWMKSPGHRKNILTPRWREIGLSALNVPAAPGVFGGRDVVVFTTDFGVR